MDLAATLMTMVPVLLAVALIVGIVAKSMKAEDPAGTVSKAVPAVVVLLVAVLIIGGIVGEDIYSYDSATKTLTISDDVPELKEGQTQPWASMDVERLVIQDGVQSVSDGAFDTLTGLKYLSIPSSLAIIGSGAFGTPMVDYTGTATESAGEYYWLHDSLCLYDDTIFTHTDGTLTGLTTAAQTTAKRILLPTELDGTAITEIGERAFSGKDASNAATGIVLERVGSPLSGYSVTSTGFRAFYYCTSMASVDLPDSLTSIGNQAFSNCTSLASVDLPDSLTEIENGAFYYCTSLASVDFPDSLTSIGSTAFRSCTSLASIDLPDSLTSIGNLAFGDCTSLASVDLPSSLTSLGDSMFSNCTSLASVDLPDSLTSIGGTAFYECTSMTSFEFPSSLTLIEGRAFEGCTGVTSVTFADDFSANINDNMRPAFPSWTFYDTDGTTVIPKTQAVGLAGHTFQGTAQALIKLAEGAKSLSKAQRIQVEELTEKAIQLELELKQAEELALKEKELAEKEISEKTETKIEAGTKIEAETITESTGS